MPEIKKYIFDPKTLTYQTVKKPRNSKLARFALHFFITFCAAVLNVWIYTSVLGFELPKTVILKKKNAEWVTRVDVIRNHLDEYDAALTMLQVRDDDIYRSLFGMSPISSEVRNAGFGGIDRYDYIDEIGDGGLLKNTAVRLDVLTKKTYIQSCSFDEVSKVAKKAGEMASCVPKISPIIPDRKNFRLSSGFGVRTDPVYGGKARHNGLDFAIEVGNPVYSTADGVVEEVTVNYSRRGFGCYVLVDHGFGYKTRYAHLSSVYVQQGMKVKRGDFLGKTGNTGKSSGPHLHYEVIYMGRPVNPVNYLDLNVTPEEYSTMVRHVEAESAVTLHPFHQKRK